MDWQNLQHTLQKKYDRETWNHILEDIFPSVNLLKVPKEFQLNNNHVKSVYQTGKVRLKDGKDLAVFEMILDDGVNLLRNRVMLRNLTREFINEAESHGVLVVYDQGKKNYRFSFVAEESGFNEQGEWVKFETATKRFTYVLGEGESCRTASERFALLKSKKGAAGLDDVIHAFSVEQLSKEFFDKYKHHYKAFVDYLNESDYRSSKFNNNDKAIRDFVKKTLGRIVFLYFVQKKGWLGASDKQYKDGDYNFMQTFWEKSGKSDTFYSEHLTRLFFNGLNKVERQDDDFLLPDNTIVKIPYLNGGLFDKDEDEPKSLNFPSVLFESLFSFFSEYNFTIDENDPSEQEVGIDPEMLGHIFEQLLENNNDTGAFYTPKEIVRFMTQESLIEYLKSGIERRSKILNEDEETALTYFVRFKLKGDEIAKDNLSGDIASFYQNQLEFIQQYGTQVNTLLRKVKVCDPAIGSGAFPMGLLNEIYHCLLLLNNTYTRTERVEIKKHIIENSIYGVDIEKGAVDIARLRFWLSLIVDEEVPNQLPNLDYKIVSGDSLISRYKDDIIKINWEYEEGEQQSLWGNDYKEELNVLLLELTALQRGFFTEDFENKEFLKNEIRNKKISILYNQLQLMVHRDGVVNKPIRRNFTNKSKYYCAVENWKATQAWKRTIEELKRISCEPEKSLEYFDWTIDFPEVLNPLIAGNDCGFDIVIGNPPYVQLQKSKGLLGELYKPMNFKTYERSGDIYALFYEQGMNLLKNNGILCYITSNKWMRASYGESLRAYFCDCNPLKLIDLGAKIFGATVDTNILLLENSKAEKLEVRGITLLDKNKLPLLMDNDYHILKGLTGSSWLILSEIEQQIRTKIAQCGTPLKDWDIKINRGILTGYNEAFIIDEETKNKLITEDPKSDEIIRPILRGRDIKRYDINFSNKFLIATFPSREYNINNYPAVKEHLLLFGYNRLKQTGDKGSRKKTNNKWFETQDSIKYWEDFFRPKMVWKRIGSNIRFSYVENNFYTLDSTVIATGNRVKYLTALLNSKLLRRELLINSPKTGTGDVITSVQALLPISIYVPTKKEEGLISNLLTKIINKRSTGLRTNIEEDIINNHIYNFYGLNNKEIEFIEQCLN